LDTPKLADNKDEPEFVLILSKTKFR